MLEADSPSEQAQGIMFQVFESRSSKKRIELAKKIDPFCKDAITWRRVLKIEHLENQSG